MNLSQLGPLVHALIAILPLAWTYIFDRNLEVTPGLVAFCALLGLLPDIDTQTSYIGRVFPDLSRFMERTYGHRTVTHSLLALFLVGLLSRLFTEDWILLSAAYGSHIATDMVIGGRSGVMLLWPLKQRYNLFNIPSASPAEATIAVLAAAFVIIPFTMPATAAQVKTVLPVLPTFTPTRLPTFTPAPVPTLVSIKIERVFDTSEIQVSAGQPISKGALLVDLRFQRATRTAPDIWQLLPTATPDPTATATPWIVPTLDPLLNSAAAADLQSALARATLAAAPPSIEEINRTCDQVPSLQSKLEEKRNNLWQNQLERDSAKSSGRETAAIDAGLAEQERQIAELEHVQLPAAIQACADIGAKPHAANPDQLAVSAADLQRAYVRYAQIVATPPPPTPRPTEQPSPTPTRTSTPDVSDTWVYSAIEGEIYEISTIAMDGLASTIRIDIAVGWGTPISQSPIPNLQSPSPVTELVEVATVTHVRDGDTLEVQFSDGTQAAIRLLDVNTPETVKPNAPIECYGLEASHYTKERFQCDDAGNNCTGVEVQLELEGSDRYGRTLAYLWLPEPVEGWILFNEELTAQGFAVYNDYGEPHHYSDLVKQAADLAQSQAVGLWGVCPLP